MVVCLLDKLLVSLEVSPKKTESGLVLPETIKPDSPTTGVVFLVGEDCRRVEIGDRVYFTRFAGTEIDFKGTRYLVVRESDVILLEKIEIPVGESACG